MCQVERWAADAAHLLRELQPVVFGCATTREAALMELLARYDRLCPTEAPVKRTEPELV